MYSNKELKLLTKEYFKSPSADAPAAFRESSPESIGVIVEVFIEELRRIYSLALSRFERTPPFHPASIDLLVNAGFLIRAAGKIGERGLLMALCTGGQIERNAAALILCSDRVVTEELEDSTLDDIKALVSNPNFAAQQEPCALLLLLVLARRGDAHGVAWFNESCSQTGLSIMEFQEQLIAQGITYVAFGKLI